MKCSPEDEGQGRPDHGRQGLGHVGHGGQGGGHGLVHGRLLLHLVDHVVVLGHREGGELEAQPPSLGGGGDLVLRGDPVLDVLEVLGAPSWGWSTQTPWCRCCGSRPCRRHSCTPSTDTSPTAARC